MWRAAARARPIAGAVLALPLALPFAASGQTPADPMAATLLPRYRLITQSFLALAEAMTADKYTWHASDHYGQLVIYSRMNGIVPPASRPAVCSQNGSAHLSTLRNRAGLS